MYFCVLHQNDERKITLSNWSDDLNMCVVYEYQNKQNQNLRRYITKIIYCFPIVLDVDFFFAAVVRKCKNERTISSATTCKYNTKNEN